MFAWKIGINSIIKNRFSMVDLTLAKIIELLYWIFVFDDGRILWIGLKKQIYKVKSKQKIDLFTKKNWRDDYLMLYLLFLIKSTNEVESLSSFDG